MAIEKIQMFTAVCDGCKKQYEGYNGWVALNDQAALKDDVDASDEWVILLNEEIYCPDCHFTEWVEDDTRLGAFSKDTQNSCAQFLGYIN